MPKLRPISAPEMLAAIRHAQGSGQTSFNIVSHSFELLSRDRTKVNHIVRQRFEDICVGIAAMDGVASGTFASTPPVVEMDEATLPRFRAGHYVHRLGQQLISNALYGGA